MEEKTQPAPDRAVGDAAAPPPLRRDTSQYAMAQKMISKYSKKKDHTLEEVCSQPGPTSGVPFPPYFKARQQTCFHPSQRLSTTAASEDAA